MRASAGFDSCRPTTTGDRRRCPNNVVTMVTVRSSSRRTLDAGVAGIAGREKVNVSARSTRELVRRSGVPGCTLDVVGSSSPPPMAPTCLAPTCLVQSYISIDTMERPGGIEMEALGTLEGLGGSRGRLLFRKQVEVA